MNEDQRYARNRKIIALRKKRRSLSAIAEELGSTKRIVQRVIAIEAPELLGPIAPHPRVITPEMGKKILAMRKRNVPYKEISELLKDSTQVSQSSLQDYVRRNAPELLREVSTDRKYLDKRMNQVAKLQRKGYTVREIADELGITFAKANGDLVKARKRDIPLIEHRKAYPLLTPEQIAKRDRQIKKMKSEGKKLREIGEKFDITQTRVSQILKD